MSNHIARQVFSRMNLFPGKTTRPSDLQALIRELNVTATEQELIRVGPDSDGGYLLPDDLDGIEYCFSPGVADCSDFELELADRGMKVFLADRSVDQPPSDDPRFDFIRKYIASTTSEEQGLITLDDWYSEHLGPPSSQSPEALLQMDIEGCEYEVLHNLSEALLGRFRIVVIEFHKLYQLADRFSFNWMAAGIRKLTRTHAVVHIHPNNNRHILSHGGVEIPATMEMTFLRRDRLKPSDRTLVFPHPLDQRSIDSKPELTLPPCWWGA